MTLGWREKRRLARVAKLLLAEDSERILQAQGATLQAAAPRRREGPARMVLIPVAAALVILLSIFVPRFIADRVAIAGQFWRTVPQGWQPAELWAEGGPPRFENPVALYLHEETGELLVTDTYTDAVYRIDERGNVSTFVTRAGFEAAVGVSLSGAADGPSCLALVDGVLYVGVSTYKTEREGGALVYVLPSGAMGMVRVRDSVDEPVSVAFGAERESRYGMVARDGKLYATGADGCVRIIELDQDPTYGRVAVLYHPSTPSSPTALAFDEKGRLYVADEARKCIERFTPEGELDPGFRLGPVERPTSLACGRDGALYVAESAEDGRIRWYAPQDETLVLRGDFSRFSERQGDDVRRFGFEGPTIAVSSRGALFVVDNTPPGSEYRPPAVYRILED